MSVLPQLINAFEYGNAGSAVLASLFKVHWVILIQLFWIYFSKGKIGNMVCICAIVVERRDLRECEIISMKCLERLPKISFFTFCHWSVNVVNYDYDYFSYTSYCIAMAVFLGCIECMRCRLLLPMIAVSVCQSLCHAAQPGGACSVCEGHSVQPLPSDFGLLLCLLFSSFATHFLLS